MSRYISPSFADDIDEQAGGENIEWVIIGHWADQNPAIYGDENEPDEIRSRKVRTGVPLTWKEAHPMLDYPYDSGFGGAQCHPVWAWTRSRVIIISEYDGATSPCWVPRNPPEGGFPSFDGTTD